MKTNSWMQEIGALWFLCIFVGVFTGGMGLFITIPIAIFGSIYIIWKKAKGEDSEFFGSSNYPHSSGGRMEDLDTMDIPHSGYSAEQRRAEYRRRGQSPSGFIDGVYNDSQRPYGVPYNDFNRDWDADD